MHLGGFDLRPWVVCSMSSPRYRDPMTRASRRPIWILTQCLHLCRLSRCSQGSSSPRRRSFLSYCEGQLSFSCRVISTRGGCIFNTSPLFELLATQKGIKILSPYEAHALSKTSLFWTQRCTRGKDKIRCSGAYGVRA